MHSSTESRCKFLRIAIERCCCNAHHYEHALLLNAAAAMHITMNTYLKSSSASREVSSWYISLLSVWKMRRSAFRILTASA